MHLGLRISRISRTHTRSFTRPFNNKFHRRFTCHAHLCKKRPVSPSCSCNMKLPHPNCPELHEMSCSLHLLNTAQQVETRVRSGGSQWLRLIHIPGKKRSVAQRRTSDCSCHLRWLVCRYASISRRWMVLAHRSCSHHNFFVSCFAVFLEVIMLNNDSYNSTGSASCGSILVSSVRNLRAPCPKYQLC